MLLMLRVSLGAFRKLPLGKAQLQSRRLPISPCGACCPFQEILVKEKGQCPELAGAPAHDPQHLLCIEGWAAAASWSSLHQASSFRSMSWRFSKEERCPFWSIAGLEYW